MKRFRIAFVFVSITCAALCGCHCCEKIPAPIARELDKVTLPDHVIEPPDVLLITGVRLVPLPPYRVEPLDTLHIRVTNTLQDEPIDGLYVVEPDGRVLLGPSYGAIYVTGKSIDEIREAVDELLKTKIKRFQVTVSLAQSHSLQLISGEHLVQPDGTVDLGSYGKVYVAGMTTTEARAAMEAHLGISLVNPKVTVSVAAFNSKVYYVITDGAGVGEQVYRLPAVGNETVLDAVSQINGLPPVASRHRIWIARPVPANEPEQILPVDWKAITRGGSTATNYQMLPGDRLYIQAKPEITFDVALSRILSPVERLLGITLLGNATLEDVRRGTSGGGR